MKYNHNGIPEQEQDPQKDWLNDNNMHKVCYGVAIGIFLFVLAYIFL